MHKTFIRNSAKILVFVGGMSLVKRMELWCELHYMDGVLSAFEVHTNRRISNTRRNQLRVIVEQEF